MSQTSFMSASGLLFSSHFAVEPLAGNSASPSSCRPQCTKQRWRNLGSKGSFWPSSNLLISFPLYRHPLSVPFCPLLNLSFCFGSVSELFQARGKGPGNKSTARSFPPVPDSLQFETPFHQVASQH